jgi:hypothetical protein
LRGATPGEAKYPGVSVESRLEAAQRRYEAARASYERRRLERNEQIRAAVAGGLTYRRIGELTGLSVQRVQQIARGGG